MASIRPSFKMGATPDETGTVFHVFAPRAQRVEVRFFKDAKAAGESKPLAALGNGSHEVRMEGVRPGALYKFVLDGQELPDPYARFMPFGVHGPAEVIERVAASPATKFVPYARYVIYELHVGTFTVDGTYLSASERLPQLAELGVTAIELMPVSASPGQRGWGYDGVAHFAAYAPYGRPEELRALVQKAHELGIAVLLDVVYNHFGPRGNYLGAYAPEYFAREGDNPWGDTPNFEAGLMRNFVIENARMWFDEFGFDGLRLDATHALRDPSPRHVLAELRELAASYQPARVLIAEDERNEPGLVSEIGLNGIWADDFHHQVRVLLTGERDGYYGAYEGRIEDLARTIERGWFFEGQSHSHFRSPRGKAAGALPASAFVYCVENHDQVGNRALGTRLDADAGIDGFRLATALLIYLPMTPLLFMGQEWAASSPFLFFTDHDAEFGPVVSKGRREEFGKFAAFADPAARDRIPDPQAIETFQRSKLRWDERTVSPHAETLSFVRALLALRRTDPVLSQSAARDALAARVEGDLLLVERSHGESKRVLVANFSRRSCSVPSPLHSNASLFEIGNISGRTLGPRSGVILGDGRS